MTQKTAMTSEDSSEKITAPTTGIHTSARIPAVTPAMAAGPALTQTSSPAGETTSVSASTPGWCVTTIKTATTMWMKTLVCAGQMMQIQSSPLLQSSFFPLL